MKSSTRLLSVVVPVYNEGHGLAAFHRSLVKVLEPLDGIAYEIIYCDDGSHDTTRQVASCLHESDERVKLIALSRNFGKESALTAGIAAARGDAILMLDGDGQHPVERIPDFLRCWQGGAQVVIGIRTASEHEGILKRLTSKLFYALFNSVTDQKLIPGSTDFRLIDRAVQRALLQLQERNRITRGLIDWLGFQREYIHFTAKAREQGRAGYSFGKLLHLAANSFVSLTPKPLYFFGYLGAGITLAAFGLGVCVIIEQLLLGDPLHWRFTGTAMLAIMILFLVGIILASQGIISLYISHIQSQSLQRPLYVIDYDHSAGLSEAEEER